MDNFYKRQNCNLICSLRRIKSFCTSKTYLTESWQFWFFHLQVGLDFKTMSLKFNLPLTKLNPENIWSLISKPKLELTDQADEHECAQLRRRFQHQAPTHTSTYKTLRECKLKVLSRRQRQQPRSMRQAQTSAKGN